LHPDIRQAHKRRLHQLRIQAALMGFSTPPEILIEIEEIQGKIKKKSRNSIRRIIQLSELGTKKKLQVASRK
jgi:hypothetical protein